jgi:hypothetical protein
MSVKLDDLYFDAATGHVVAKMSHENGAQHRLQIIGGFDSCPHCGHVVPKNNLGEVDIRAILAAELAAFEKAQADTGAWVRKFNVPLKKKAK